MDKWIQLAIKVPAIIGGIMGIVERVRGRGNGAEKHAEVVASIPEALALTELAAGRDLFNDATIAKLRDEYMAAVALGINAKREVERIQAEAQAIIERTRTALEAGILAKKPAA